MRPLSLPLLLDHGAGHVHLGPPGGAAPLPPYSRGPLVRRAGRRAEEGFKILHAGVVALLQLVLVGLLVLLDELPVPLQRVPGLLEEVLEAEPELVLVLAGHLAGEQLL